VRRAAGVEKRRYHVGIFAMDVKRIDGKTTEEKALAYAGIASFHGMTPKELVFLHFQISLGIEEQEEPVLSVSFES
jgi:hypothetical protein